MRTSKARNDLALYSFSSILAAISILAYLLVELIPLSASFDIIGPHWLYIAIVDLCVLLFFYFDKIIQKIPDGSRILLHPSFLSYTGYTLGAAISVIFAINTGEYLVAISRTIITIIAIINFIILLQRTNIPFIYIAQVISIFTAISCLNAVRTFFDTIPLAGLDEAILKMQGGLGNKNIFASGIVIKFPFILYCIYRTNNNLQKVFNALLILLVIYTLLLANARSAYLGILLQCMILFTWWIIEQIKEKKIKILAYNSALLFTPIILAVLLSVSTIENQRKLYDIDINYYGTITERLTTIEASNTATSGRFNIWNEGIQVFKNRPLTGVGHGNWKIGSIPYEKYELNEATVSYHAHNDFLETFGELGIIGGLLYLGAFILIFIVMIRQLLKKGTEQHPLLLFAFLGLSGYLVDAMLNFPLERTSMQVFFALWYAIALTGTTSTEKKPTKWSVGLQKNFIPIAGILLLPAIYISNEVFTSLKVQAYTYNDIAAEQPAFKADMVINEFPSIPTLTQTGLPIDAFKGRYLVLEGRYDEARPLIKKGIAANPYLGYGQFIFGLSLFRQQKYDSAYTYASEAFSLRPRNYAYYGLYMNTLIQRKDSIAIKNAFDLYRRYRPEPDAWNVYLFALTQLNYPPAYLKQIADSALVLFPNDEKVKNNAIAVMQMQTQQPNAQQTNAGTPAPTMQEFFNKGLEQYANKQYQQAIRSFKKAVDIAPNYYPAIENIGMSYYALNDFANALTYYQRVVDSGLSADGKSEFFAGICLINIGRKAEGCASFEKAKKKNYFDAERLIGLNCR